MGAALAYELSDGTVAAVLGVARAGGAAYLQNLAVDLRHQRSGIGTAVVEALVARLRAGPCDGLSLTVHPDNAAAQALYAKVGFVPTGDVVDGEPVWSLALS